MTKAEKRARFVERQRAAQRANDESRGYVAPVPKPRQSRRARDPFANTYMRDPDGYDRDNLGESRD